MRQYTATEAWAVMGHRAPSLWRTSFSDVLSHLDNVDNSTTAYIIISALHKVDAPIGSPTASLGHVDDDNDDRGHRRARDGRLDGSSAAGGGGQHRRRRDRERSRSALKAGFGLAWL